MRTSILSATIALLLLPNSAWSQFNWVRTPSNPCITTGIDPGVIYDSAKNQFEMWYVDPNVVSVKHAISLDGIQWTTNPSETILAPGAQGTIDGKGISSVSVLHVGSSYYMYYTALGVVSGGSDTLRICAATSSDGVKWQKYIGNPIISTGSKDSWEEMGVFLPRAWYGNGLFYIFYGGEDATQRECTGYATSPDGLHWTKYSNNPVLLPDLTGWASFNAIPAAITKKDSTYYLLYGGDTQPSSPTQIGIATSKDLNSWAKSDRNPVIPFGGPGQWDQSWIGGGTLLYMNGKFMYWYVGYGSEGWCIGLATSHMLLVRPQMLEFGSVNLGQRDTLSVQISNGGDFDTLRIDSIHSSNSRFTASQSSMVVPPGASKSINVVYAPVTTARDTGTLWIAGNDPANPVFALTMTGTGFGLSHAPTLHQISLTPYNANLAQLNWFRSIDDTTGAADPVTQYSVWRRVLGTGAQSTRPPAEGVIAPASTEAAWTFIVTVPAIGLYEYAAVVPIPYVPSSVPPWYVFIVVAQTKGMQVYTSLPDSILDPASLTGIGHLSTGEVPGEFVLRQNFPNPFNPSTTIQYGLPVRTNVSLIVYNGLGQVVSTLVDQEEAAGYHEARFDGTNVASGVYFCTLRAGSFVRTVRLLLVR